MISNKLDISVYDVQIQKSYVEFKRNFKVKFIRKNNIPDKDAYLNSQLYDSIEFMKEVIDLTSIKHHRIIKRLATELNKIFLELHKQTDKQKMSLWNSVFNNQLVPKILSIEEIFDVDYQKFGFKSANSIVDATFFATSLKLSNGAYKPVILTNEKISVADFLKTKILRLPKEGSGFKDFTVKDIILLMRNKETSHVDSKSLVQNSNDPFRILEKLDERYLIILGLVEFTIGVSEIYTKQSCCYFIEDNKETCYVNIKDYIENPLGETFPTFIFNTDNGLPGVSSSFQLFRTPNKGENFHIFSTGIISFYINDNLDYAVECEGDAPIIIPAKSKIQPRKINTHLNLYTTLRLYHSWGNFFGILDATDFVEFERDITDIYLCYLIECRANAWFKLGNMEASLKKYEFLHNLSLAQANDRFIIHINKMIEEIKKNIKNIKDKKTT